jgi:fucose 4-O-acetylase-like acetyltransferase
MLSTAPSANRIALWDNARLVLMVLVIFGHSIEGIRAEGSAATAVYDVVYAFHMPAFLLISGWFASAGRFDRRALRGTAKLLITWLLAEAAWVGLRALLGRTAIPGSFLVTPSWTLWFLVSLIAMRLLLPVIAAMRFPLITTTAVALAAGLSPAIGTPFSLGRTLALLPFFVLGSRLRQRGLGEQRWFVAPSRRLRLAASGVLAAGTGTVLLLLRLPDFTDQLLFWRRGYAAMGLDDVSGVLLRGTFLLIGAAMTLALLVVIPRRSFRLSALGRNTLPVYLLHAPLIVLARKADLDDAIGALPLALPILLAVAVLLVPLLASRAGVLLARPLTDPMRLLRTS